MTYAAVLTHVQADADTAPRLACAIDIAGRFNAALIGVGAEMIPPLAFDGGYYSLEADWTTAMRGSIEARLKLARENFVAAAETLGDRAIWAAGLELPGPAIAAASRAADLVVAGGAPHRRADTYRDASPGELALTSGRPILVAPSKAPPLGAKHVVLAWKDSREARRAMTDAMPFFEGADSVLVLAVCAEIDVDQAKIEVDDVVQALTRRGVKATGKVSPHAHSDGKEILAQAGLANADLIVAGAYGHTRFGEWVFGGVTRDLLLQDDLYLLLSH